MSRSFVLASGAAAAIYLTYDAYTNSYDPDQPRLFPMRRAVHRLFSRFAEGDNIPKEVIMVRDKTCTLGKVLFNFVEAEQYPRGDLQSISTTLKPPTDHALCMGIEHDTNTSTLGSGSYGYVKPHPSNPDDLVYKQEFNGRDELQNEAAVMTIINPLRISPKLISWCPRQNAIVSERMNGTLLDEDTDWSSWSLAAQLRLVHSPMQSVLAKSGHIAAQTVLDVYINLLQALNGIHNLDLVHRDIHMGNIMYNSKEKKWLLIDFGLAGAATPTYKSFDLAGLAMAMLSLANMIELDWPDLVVAHHKGTVRWVDTHPCVRFRKDHHKGPVWTRIFGAIRASMTLRPEYASSESLLSYLESPITPPKAGAKAETKPEAKTKSTPHLKKMSGMFKRTSKKGNKSKD
jgi:serine/threonine protein kinase